MVLCNFWFAFGQLHPFPVPPHSACEPAAREPRCRAATGTPGSGEILLLLLPPSWAPSPRCCGRNQPSAVLTLCCDATSVRNGSSPSVASPWRRDSKWESCVPSPPAPRCRCRWVADAAGKDLGAHRRCWALLKRDTTVLLMWAHRQVQARQHLPPPLPTKCLQQSRDLGTRFRLQGDG